MLQQNLLQSVTCITVWKHELRQLDQALQKLVEGHVAFVLIHLAEDEVDPLLVYASFIFVFLRRSAPRIVLAITIELLIDLQNASILQHLVKLLRFEMRCIQPVSKRCVKIENLFQFSLGFFEIEFVDSLLFVWYVFFVLFLLFFKSLATVLRR